MEGAEQAHCLLVGADEDGGGPIGAGEQFPSGALPITSPMCSWPWLMRCSTAMRAPSWKATPTELEPWPHASCFMTAGLPCCDEAGSPPAGGCSPARPRRFRGARASEAKNGFMASETIMPSISLDGRTPRDRHARPERRRDLQRRVSLRSREGGRGKSR